jgi:hypothetical protein
MLYLVEYLQNIATILFITLFLAGPTSAFFCVGVLALAHGEILLSFSPLSAINLS